MSRYLEKNLNAWKLLLHDGLCMCSNFFLHIATHSSSACVRYLRRYHLQKTAPSKVASSIPSNNELSAEKVHYRPLSHRLTPPKRACKVTRRLEGWANVRERFPVTLGKSFKRRQNLHRRTNRGLCSTQGNYKHTPNMYHFNWEVKIFWRGEFSTIHPGLGRLAFTGSPLPEMILILTGRLTFLVCFPLSS